MVSGENSSGVRTKMVENKPVPQSSWNCNTKWKLKQKFWFLARGTDEAHQKSSRSMVVRLELVSEPLLIWESHCGRSKIASWVSENQIQLPVSMHCFPQNDWFFFPHLKIRRFHTQIQIFTFKNWKNLETFLYHTHWLEWVDQWGLFYLASGRET